MGRQIIINATPRETRVATVENARLLQIEIERASERGLAGSIHKGRVTRVLPGMQAAFVDIGLEKSAFLPGADFFFLDATELADTDVAAEDAEGATVPTAELVEPRRSGKSARRALPPIEERLTKEQEVIVQVAKEPIGTKGARVTSNISLPGRLLVYLPGSDQVGISRRIEDEGERARLQHAVETVLPKRGGVIVRTACEGVTKREIQADLRILRKLWRSISRAAEDASAPAALHQDLDVILRTVRDISVLDVGKIVIDRRADHERIRRFAAEVMPRTRLRVDLYQHPEPIFERYGIEAQINRALERRVWLRSGGYIVIDPTEALTAVDVNTGRFVGRSDQRDTALRTNLEAAHVIAAQLRLRNIGGLIVIDFIDMEHEGDRQKVLAAFNDALRAHRTRAQVSDFSPLGLVEMTRHRNRESLAQRLCEPCPTCNGRAIVKGTATTAYEVLRAIRREAVAARRGQRIVATIHPEITRFLAEHEPSALRELEDELGVEVTVRDSADPDPPDYSVAAGRTG